MIPTTLGSFFLDLPPKMKRMGIVNRAPAGGIYLPSAFLAFPGGQMMTNEKLENRLSLCLSVTAIFASVIACIFISFLWISRDVDQRNGTPDVIIVEKVIESSSDPAD